MSDIGPRLRNTLGQRAEQVSVTGDFAQRAIALEHRNHRRRVAAGAVGAALALAVSVPVAFSAITRDTQAPVPATSGTSAPTTTSTPTTSPTSSIPTRTSESPATIVPPTTTQPAAYSELRDAYAVGDTLRIGGSTIQLQKGTLVKSFAVLDGGGAILTSSMGDEANDHEILDASGKTIHRIDATATDSPGRVVDWAVSPDGRRVIFSTGEKATVFDASGTVVTTLSTTGRASAIVGDRAYLRASDVDPSGSSTEWNVSSGATRELPAGVRAVSADGRFAALNWREAADDYSSCWAVVDLQDGLRKTFERCGGYFIPESFSANGTYVVGQHYIDGGDVYNLAMVRAADGKPVVGGEDKADWFLGWTMRLSADEKSLLVARNTTPEGGDRPSDATLVRCSLDLECTNVEPERSFTTIGWPPYVVGR